MKKLRPEVEKDIPNNGGLFELADMVFLSAFNVTIDELEYICGNVTPEEEQEFIEFGKSFSQSKRALEIRNKYLKMYNEETSKPS